MFLSLKRFAALHLLTLQPQRNILNIMHGLFLIASTTYAAFLSVCLLLLYFFLHIHVGPDRIFTCRTPFHVLIIFAQIVSLSMSKT